MDGRICGTVAVDENEITKIYVDPTAHHHNVGRTLFELAQKAVTKAGHAELTAWAAFDSVIPFYERMGMSTAGRKFDILGKTQGRNTMLMKKPVGMKAAAEQGAPADAASGAPEL